MTIRNIEINNISEDFFNRSVSYVIDINTEDMMTFASDELPDKLLEYSKDIANDHNLKDRSSNQFLQLETGKSWMEGSSYAVTFKAKQYK